MDKKKVVNTIILDDEGRFLIIKRTKTAPIHPDRDWETPVQNTTINSVFV